jgi:hypothetical protein
MVVADGAGVSHGLSGLSGRRPPPAWDEDRALELIGLRVLIGITHAGPDGHRMEQMFGIVRIVDRARGIMIALEGVRAGEDVWLPPHLDAFKPADPGTYRLRSTGEEVVDPDLLSTWTINPPKQ